MCKVVEENPTLAREPEEVNAVKKLPSFEIICQDINRILTPTVEHGEVLGSKSLPTHQNDCKLDSSAEDGTKDMVTDSDPTPTEKKEGVIEMDESSDAELNENAQNSDAGVIVLDE